jgi:hypothetical protein
VQGFMLVPSHPFSKYKTRDAARITQTLAGGLCHYPAKFYMMALMRLAERATARPYLLNVDTGSVKMPVPADAQDAGGVSGR